MAAEVHKIESGTFAATMIAKCLHLAARLGEEPVLRLARVSGLLDRTLQAVGRALGPASMFEVRG
jgi:hypothetical protein